MQAENLQGKYRSIPHKPGVYLFKDQNQTILYVGKAANLHHRVRSYFNTQLSSAKLRRLVGRIADIDYILTSTEQEAFLLENNLIKKHQPYYNVRLKDDKSYPYLKITLGEQWPRVHVTRRLKDDGGRYFGPFASSRSLRRTTHLLNKLFPYRTCRMPITGDKDRPCLKYHIHRCSGPCTGAVGSAEYLRIIDQVTLFLEGRYDQVVRDLKKKMAEASAMLEFEKAAVLRDQIQAIDEITQQQKVVSSSRAMEDVIAIAQEKDHACAEVFFIRGGKITGEEHFILEGVSDESPQRVMAGFIRQYYGSGANIPPVILVQTLPAEAGRIEEWLGSKRGGKFRLKMPQRGEKKRLMDMVSENAMESLNQFQRKRLVDSGKTAAALDDLRIRLMLPRLPNRIECYDISNTGGTHAVGSMAVFLDGQPKPASYRRFRIKSVSGIDDYGMMQEVLWRRFGKGVRKRIEARDSSWDVMPDLVLIDGGKGHLNAIMQVLERLELDAVPVAAIAKAEEEVFLPQLVAPVVLPANSEALYLLQRVRDEAHRFAISYHVRTRSKSALTSALDQVPGIGAKRRKELISRFGSIRGIREAGVDELASVSGMNRELAQRIKDGL